MKNRAIAALFFMTYALGVGGQQAETIDVPLVFGQTAVTVDKLAGRSAEPAPTIVTVTDAGAVTSVRAGKETVTFKKDNAPSVVATFTVAAIPVQISMRRDTEPFATTDETTTTPALVGDTFEYNVSRIDSNGGLTPLTPRTPDKSATFVTHGVEGSTGKIRFGDLPNTNLINPPPTLATATFTTDDGVVHTLRFQVVENIATVRTEAPPTLFENTDTRIPITVVGANGGIYQSKAPTFASSYQYDCAAKPDKAVENMVSVTAPSPGTIVAKLDVDRLKATDRVARGTIVCTAHPIGRQEKSKPSDAKDVRFEASGGFIGFVPPLLNVVAGQAANVRAIVYDRTGKTRDAKVTWSIVEATDAAVITPGAGNDASILTLPDPSKLPEKGVLTIRATTPNIDDAGTPITADLLVKITSPSGFTRVSGAIELLDYQTARDLYGIQTINDFYAAKITLLNDLQDEPDRKLVGASILVFSSSLAIGVNLEKTEAKGRKLPRKDAEWKPVTFGDLRSLGLPASYRIPSWEARPNITRPKRDDKGNILGHELDEMPVYTCDDIWFAEQEVELTPEQELLPREQQEELRARLVRQRNAQVAAARLRQLHYRPYPYDMVVKSFDPRDARSGRSWTFRALTFAGSLASFISGVGNFGPGNDLISVNEKFGNILVPALASLWPSLKETQRQNLVSDTMHPIEEIPYASSLTKVVFLPKYPFQGFKRGYWYRVSEVCPFNFQVDVAVAPKDSRSTETVTAPAANTPR